MLAHDQHVTHITELAWFVAALVKVQVVKQAIMVIVFARPPFVVFYQLEKQFVRQCFTDIASLKNQTTEFAADSACQYLAVDVESEGLCKFDPSEVGEIYLAIDTCDEIDVGSADPDRHCLFQEGYKILGGFAIGLEHLSAECRKSE